MTPQDTERIKQAAEERYEDKYYYINGHAIHGNRLREIAIAGATAEAQHWAPIVDGLQYDLKMQTLQFEFERDEHLKTKQQVANRDKTISSLKDDVKELVDTLKEINEQLAGDGTLSHENLTLTEIYEANEVLIAKYKQP